MREIEELLVSFAEKYPLSEPQDAVKLLYQSAFGSGHMVVNTEDSYAFLMREYNALDKTGTVLIEPVGNGMTRVYLSGLDAEALAAVNKLFVFGANECERDPAYFAEGLACLRSLARQHRFPYPFEALDAYLKKYEAAGCPAVHHSNAYRNAYAPAYRVMPSSCACLIETCARTDHLLKTQPHVVLTMDGRCGSGKTTLAGILKQLYGAAVIHMDDFFVPPTLRDEEHRLLPVDYERFSQEVLPHIRSGEAFAYRRYDCSVRQLAGSVSIPETGLLIAEGSYSAALRFGKYFDLYVYVTCDKDTQSARIRARNLPRPLFDRFFNEFIPAEEAYNERESAALRADCVIKT